LKSRLFNQFICKYSFTTSQRTQSLYIRQTNLFILFRETNLGRDSSVSLVTRLRDGRYGFRIPEGQVIWFFIFGTQIGSGAHPASYSMGRGVLSRGAKHPGCDFDHSPPCSYEVKNEWRYISSPPMRFHGVGREKLNFLRKIIA